MQFVVIPLETVLVCLRGEHRRNCRLDLDLLGIEFDDIVLERGVLITMLKILCKEEM